MLNILKNGNKLSWSGKTNLFASYRKALPQLNGKKFFPPPSIWCSSLLKEILLILALIFFILVRIK